MIRTLALLLMPVQATALTLDLPANATLTLEQVTGLDSYEMPTGPWTPDGMPILTASGEVSQQAWRIDAAGLTTLQLLQPLQDQMTDDGFEVLFTCTDDACGGFDFRFATPVLPAPEMFVDLGDYRYVAAQKTDENGAELISLFASRSASAGYIQVIRVGPPEQAPIATSQAAAISAVRVETPIITGDLAQSLESAGHFTLSDLAFATGSAQLDDADFASLEGLADYLIANPQRTVALVGHTDSTGSLDGNIALSKRRAGSVLERLVSTYNIPRRQLEAEGVGYLAPIESNLTEAGRTANRRVVVIVTSTE